MNDYNAIKNTLFSIIRDMGENLDDFVVSPGKDYTKKRKLSFEDITKSLLLFEGSSLNKDLIKYFDYSPSAPSASAFCQQRAKLLPEAFFYLLQTFNGYFKVTHTYHGYHLIACDGSDCLFAPDKRDTEHYMPCNSYAAVNSMHLNVFYDLMEHRFLDAVIQPQKYKNECRAFCQMTDRFTADKNTIFIADRNYEAYNNIIHVVKKNMKFLFRVKDRKKNGILYNIAFPDTQEFDCIVPLTLTRKHSSLNRKENRIYKRISTGHVYDYMEELEENDYDLNLRVIRIETDNEQYETLITNLPYDEFSANDIRELYHMRWGVENAFRDLKCTLSLTRFHAKKAFCVRQEILARLVMYNYCAVVTSMIKIKQGNTKYIYKINFSMAVNSCRDFLKNQKSNKSLEVLIKKYLLPLRPGRRYRRVSSHKGVQSHNYRN